MPLLTKLTSRNSENLKANKVHDQEVLRDTRSLHGTFLWRQDIELQNQRKTIVSK